MWQMDPPPPIDHRFMQDHYTDYVSHIDICTDTSADRPQPPPPINHRSMEDHYTSAERSHPLLQSVIHFWKTTTLQQFHGRLTPPPPPINNRSMQDHYTNYISHIDVCTYTSADRPHPLLQSTIDLCKTTTPVQRDPTPSSNQSKISGKPLHCISFMAD